MHACMHACRQAGRQTDRQTDHTYHSYHTYHAYHTYIEVPAAAVAITPSLICYFSISTVACIWYNGFLPPTLFGVSCQF